MYIFAYQWLFSRGKYVSLFGSQGRYALAQPSALGAALCFTSLWKKGGVTK